SPVFHDEESGTAMALDEGKMGKKDSDEQSGQYRMRNENVDPQLARQQAIEQARTAGILGSSTNGAPPAGGDISSGFDDTNVYGSLRDSSMARRDLGGAGSGSAAPVAPSSPATTPAPPPMHGHIAAAPHPAPDVRPDAPRAEPPRPRPAAVA